VWVAGSQCCQDLNIFSPTLSPNTIALEIGGGGLQSIQHPLRQRFPTKMANLGQDSSVLPVLRPSLSFSGIYTLVPFLLFRVTVIQV
jgi:hypothetical protein